MTSTRNNPKDLAESSLSQEHSRSSNCLFSGVKAYFVEAGVSPRRLKIWNEKIQQFGGCVEDRLSHETTHVFAADVAKLKERLTLRKLKRHHMEALRYEWIQDCLKEGMLLPYSDYALKEDRLVKEPGSENEQGKSSDMAADNEIKSKGRTSSEGSSMASFTSEEVSELASEGDSSLCYLPPNLNQNITQPFMELRDIYKDALGDDRRSFSYHKAISVIEKIPYKIESIDQVKGLPTIGKSMLEHVLLALAFAGCEINEILTTGKLSKLENFKNDDRVRTLTLFSSVWGIGPVTAQKLYDKGYKTLDDLKKEPSLTASQNIGLQFYDDLKVKIPRNEVKEMESLVKQVSEEVQPGISVLCGGSYRRGKLFCSDLDFVIMHSDGKSHKGFLTKLIAALKKRDFLTEDLLVSAHNSIEGTDAGVDTYYGLCKYPGRQLRHRIDFKVYSAEMYPFGLIAWTGNDVLNRRLRLLAESKGCRLDDTGLYPTLKDSHGKKAQKCGTSVACKSEKEVFEFLGFPWLEPHERNL